MDRSEFPNAERLQELREIGLFPYSLFTTRALGAASGIVCLSALRSEIGLLVEQIKLLLTLAGTVTEPAEIARVVIAVMRAAFPVATLPTLCVITVMLLTGLLQTRFYLRFGPVDQRIVRALTAHRSTWQRPLFRLARATVVLLSGGAVTLLLLRSFVPKTLALISSDPSTAVRWGAEFMQTAAIPLSVALCVAAVASWLTARFSFMLEHRMTPRGFSGQQGSDQI